MKSNARALRRSMTDAERRLWYYLRASRLHGCKFRRFVTEYNTLRPHEALDQDPPARHYRAAERAYPEQLSDWDYPGHMEVRKVDCTGRIAWHDRPVRVGKALRGEHVGLEEVDDQVWVLFFRGWQIGRFDEARMRISG